MAGKKTYKNVIGFLKHLGHLAKNQDMSDYRGWDQLTEDEQRLFYGLITGIQNDLGEIQNSFDERGRKVIIYQG